MQRELQLLENGIAMGDLKINTDFNLYFGDDNIISDVLSDVLLHYNSYIDSKPVSNVKFNPADMILGDIYQSKFKRDSNDSMFKIQSIGSNYFKDKISINFEPDENPYDLKFITNEKTVYIKYVTELPPRINTINIKENPEEEKTYSRYDEFGNKLYDIVNDMVVSLDQDNNEVIYLKVGDKVKNVISYNDNFQGNLNKLVRSFEGLTSIIPLSNSDIYDKISTHNLYEVNYNQFKKFFKLNYSVDNTYDKDWFNRNKESLLNLISKKTYTS